MKRVFLVRHGESKWNTLKKVQGQKNIPLTENGIDQAHLIGNRLINENIDIIYSSHLDRAKDTANIIGQKTNVNVNTMEALQEINFGIWEGMSQVDVDKNYNKDFVLWRKQPENLKIEKGETLEDLQARAMKGVNSIINNDLWENIVIVSHSATLKAIILGLLNVDLCHFKNLTLNNVSLTIIEFRDYNRVIKVLNDVSHLKENK